MIRGYLFSYVHSIIGGRCDKLIKRIAIVEFARQSWVIRAMNLRPYHPRSVAKEVSMPAKRTTHRSSKGTKLYAVRDKKGQFKDIQTYKRAHGQDVKRKSKKEK